MSLNIKSKYIAIAILILIMLFLQLGYYSSTFKQIELFNRGNYLTNFDLFIKILIQNSTFYFLIILGSLFFNISSIMLICYNSFAWGYSAKMSISQIGFFKSFLLIGPHITIEILWIICSFLISYNISLLLLSFFNNHINEGTFVKSIRSKIKLSLYGYCLDIFGCFVEIFISPLIFKLL